MKINYYFLFLLLILSSCEKRENIEMSTKNSENHALKGRLSSLGFNQIDPGKLQKGISYHEIASDDELDTLLDHFLS